MDMVTEIKDGVVDGTPGGIQQQIQVCDSGLHEWKDTEELGARERKIDVDVDGTLVRGIQ